MKGQPIPLRIPRAGQQRSTVPHLAPAEAVVDGQNMLVTLDGRYGVRPGYEQYGDGSLIERPLGGIFFRDVNSSPQFVVAGATSWARYTSGSGVWADITPAGDPLTGDNFTPVRFTTYQQSSQVWVLGANNVDKIKRWEPTLAEYSEVAAAPACRDLTVLANRILTVNTIESGTRFASRVRWSAEADATTYPALAFFDLDHAGEPNVGIAALSRLTAAVYRTESIWVVTAQPGGDATAFAPELVSSGIAGPVGPASVVAVDRQHYYVGRDNKIYRFDGVQPAVISDPIGSQLDEKLDADQWGRVHGVYFARRREIWWWIPQVGETAPQSAFVYDVDDQRWEVEQRFSIGVTFSIQAEDARENTWDNVTATWDTVTGSWDAYRSGPNLVVLLGAEDSRVLFFGEAVDDEGSPITFSWTHPVIYAGEEKQLLADEVESFFKTVAATSPTVNVSVYGLQQPLGNRDLLFTGALDLASAARLRVRKHDTSYDATNYRPGVQVEYTGSTPDRTLVEWGGGQLIVHSEEDG